MKAVNLSKMDVKALNDEIAALKRELFDLKLGAVASHVKDNSQFKKLRVRIAQALTYVNQKEQSE